MGLGWAVCYSKKMKERTCFTKLKIGKNWEQEAGYVIPYLVLNIAQTFPKCCFGYSFSTLWKYPSPVFGGEKLIASLDYTVGSRDQNSKYDVFYSSLCTFLLSL